MIDFDPIFRDASAHGVIVGVALPSPDIEISPTAWRKLRREEIQHAQTLKGHRLTSWVGGRIAAHSAINILGMDSGPILFNERGGPTLSEQVSLSISHKPTMAIALASRSELGTVGVDLECFSPKRAGIMDRVLSKNEIEKISDLDEDCSWISLLQRFSTKESIYKALSPMHHRMIGFDEAEVFPNTDGTSLIRLYLHRPPYPQNIEARYIWLEDHLITTVRAQWT
jgi:phosphopantetheine--protein transferase-like protein